MKKKVVKFGTPIGPYSPGLVLSSGSQKTLFISGQIPVDPLSGEIISMELEDQIKQVFANLQAVVDEAGFDFGDVVKVTIFLVDLSHFAAVNEAYRKCFKEPYPVRSTLQVAALPKGALLEIEAMAIRLSEST